MKKMMFRKFLIDYLSFFIIALLSSSVIIWVFQAVNYLDIMIEDGRDYIVYIKFSLLNFPKILTRLMPFVLFFSLFYITTKYENNNQLIIFWNFGVHKIELTNFLIKVSFILMIIQIFLLSIIVPKSQDLARNYIRNSNVNFFENFIKPQKFNDTIRGVTIYTEKKDENGNLFNLYLKKEDNNNQFQITYAKKGVFKEFNKTPVLVLYDGETIKGSDKGITNFKFSKSDFPLNNFETNTTTYIKTQELSTIKLFSCINSIYLSKLKKPDTTIENCTIQNSKKILEEFYKRIFIPFYIPLLVLITFLLMLSSKENSNYNKLKIFTFLFNFFFIIFSETTVKFISNKFYENIYIAIIPFLIFLLLYSLLFKKLNKKLN